MDDKKLFDVYLEGETLPNFESLSGTKLKGTYTREDLERDESNPGEFPFTRGIHKEMYRKRLWTRRQQSGFGTPEESNERLMYLLKQGMTGLNIDFDVATKLGIDPDHPLARGDVGLQGTSLATLEDMDKLFQGIPLDKVSSTLIANAPYSAVILAMYVLIAKKRNFAQSSLLGTIMNCAISQLVGPTYESGTRFFPVDQAIKIACDVIEFTTKHMPRWNCININAYNIRDTGVNAVQEAAFAFTLAEEYIRQLLDRGLSIDEFAGRVAFFTSAHIDFLEEIAKIRAMRRIWANLMKNKYGAKNPKSCFFRTAIQTSALPLTAQQPLNNLSRAAIQTLIAVLAGTQSIHTTSYDEAYSLPTEESHKLAIRTQQVIAYETNVCKTVDPLGGSYAIESLTDTLEEKILALMEQIESMGGFTACFKSQWIESHLNNARYDYANKLESGEQLSVGVNIFREEDEEIDINIFRPSEDMQKRRMEYIHEFKGNRDQKKTEKSLRQLYTQTRQSPDSNCLPAIIQAVEDEATLGEISDTLREAYDFKVEY
jgi:methylmalonyl-CoA mutase N-terminal domain/subunit